MNHLKCFECTQCGLCTFFLDRFVRQCLCFLSAVVSQGPEAARDVFSQIHVSKGLISLARRRDKTVSALQTVNSA